MKTWSYGINSLLSDLRGRKGKGQKSEDRRQKTEDRGQRTEVRGQRTDVGGQMSEDRGQNKGIYRKG